MKARSRRPHNGEIELCEHPIFVVGAPRSGTTGFARALARHSELWTSTETLFISDLFGSKRLERHFDWLANRPHAAWLGAEGVEREEFLAYVGLGLNALLTSRSGGRRWIDHTPHHVYMVDTLAAMFPGALFLHIVREGRAAVDSMTSLTNNYDAEFQERMRAGDFLPRWTHDFEYACETWRDAVEAGIAASASHPRRCLTVRHERLTAAPRTEFRRIFRFIRVPFEEKPLAAWASRRVNSSFKRVDEHRQAMTGEERAEDWTAEQRQLFAVVAGPVAERLQALR